MVALLTVAAVKAEIRESQYAGTTWIQVGLRSDGDGGTTFNALDWPTVDGDWDVDLDDFAELRDVLSVLRGRLKRGEHVPVELDLYCYRANGRGRYAEVELLGNVELNLDADGVGTVSSYLSPTIVLKGA